MIIFHLFLFPLPLYEGKDLTYYHKSFFIRYQSILFLIYFLYLEDSHTVVKGRNSANLPSLKHTISSQGLGIKHTSDGKHG